MRTRLGALSAAVTLLAAGLSGSALADPGDVPTPGSRASVAGQDARAAQAEAALAEVAAIFGDTPAGAARAGAGAHAREATMALLELYKTKHVLTGARRASAEAYLARPTDGGNDGPGAPKYGSALRGKSCATNICVHWAESGPHAPALTDASPANNVPDYVDVTRTTLQAIHGTYRAAGYKAPKSDKSSTNNGGTAKTDIYLADIGADNGLYGYCTSDDPARRSFDVSAYCVLDNDYAPAQFPANTPLGNLQVTAAHEYFHAVQFAYDAWEDRWFMEASATWAEDEVFDGIDDNVGYLPSGQLGFPDVPLDFFQNGGSFHYGNWIFLRYLTERFPAEAGAMPKLVRNLWNKVDAATKDDPDMYAIQAIKSELTALNSSFSRMYAKYADATRRQGSFSEGVANNYPVTPFVNAPLNASNSTGQISQPLYHQTFATHRITPDADMTDLGWQLNLSFDLPDKLKGSAVMVAAMTAGGSVHTYAPIPLSTAGNGSLGVPFSTAQTQWVEVTLVNASTRFNCWVSADSPISCLGTSKDDNFTAKFTATAVLN